MNYPKVSISVPVYNMERHICQCLDSLINQTLKDIEIIIVDDGSSDGSPLICDSYANKDNRIKVIHKHNGGSASARQCGLEYCTGEYYTVCDSDDWLDWDFCEIMYKKAIEYDADVVLSQYYANYPDGKSVKCGSYEYSTQEQYICDVMSRKIDPMTCSKLIRAKLFRDYDISYKEGINLGEDALILYKLLKHPLHIVSVDRAFYHYRRDMTSLSYTNNVTMETLKQLEYVDRWKRENYTDVSYNKTHLISAINLCCTALRVSNISSMEFSNIINKVSIREILYNKIITLKSLCVIFTKFFGLKLSRYLFGKLYHLYYK
uniref:glycosyltransferase family 2 protein n=1 Tax=Alistipes sp. TaxID=1872444 RepID=UPI004055FB40